MVKSIQGVGLTALGGMLWSGYIDSAKASPLVLRPPAAIDEEDFLSACIKCGLCAEACKNRETNTEINGMQKQGTIQMAKGGDQKMIGTPFLIPRETPCYMCDDIPCVPVCPSGALDKSLVSNLKKELDINKAKMGLAVVHKESCIANWGLQCDACYRACPLLGEAITIELKQNERTGKHALMLPIVNDDACTGCGLCEKACVTEKPAIFVLPLKIAKGLAGDHYVRGWEEKDDKKMKNATAEESTTEVSNQNSSDYLNSTEEF